VKYTSINDPQFSTVVSLRDAYRICYQFIADYHSRGDVPVVDLLAYSGVAPDGHTSDPAAADDFLVAARKVLADPESKQIG